MNGMKKQGIRIRLEQGLDFVIAMPRKDV